MRGGTMSEKDTAIMHLIGNLEHSDNSPVSAVHAVAAGAPVEVEVTPEMIKAGTLEYLTYDSRFEDVEDVVRRVYHVMSTAKS
jgi:hypothetical protein